MTLDEARERVRKRFTEERVKQIVDAFKGYNGPEIFGKMTKHDSPLSEKDEELVNGISKSGEFTLEKVKDSFKGIKKLR